MTAPVRLYREILRLHARQLPPVMRELGGRVLREEWRAMLTAHRNGKATPAHAAEFSAQWRRYADALAAGPPQDGGAAELHGESLEAQLNPDQRVQLARMRAEAAKLRGAPEADG